MIKIVSLIKMERYCGDYLKLCLFKVVHCFSNSILLFQHTNYRSYDRNIIKVNTIQDGGGNVSITSNGSGTLTTNNIGGDNMAFRL